MNLRVYGLGFPGFLSNQGEKSINFVFHSGSFKKKVLKYGTPKPSFWVSDRVEGRFRV